MYIESRCDCLHLDMLVCNTDMLVLSHRHVCAVINPVLFVPRADAALVDVGLGV